MNILSPKQFLFILLILISSMSFAQVTVNSLSELKPYLDHDSINVTLSSGVYAITAADVEAKKFSNPLLLVSGNGSTYNFDGVIINIETAVMQAFGRADITQIQVVGNNNVLNVDTSDPLVHF